MNWRSMRVLLLAFTATAMLMAPSGCKRRGSNQGSTTQPDYQPLSVTFDEENPPPTSDPAEALQAAMLLRDVTRVRLVLAQHPALVKQKFKDALPLETACDVGSVEIVKALVEHKADLAIRSQRYNWSMLYLAVASDSVPLVKYLITQGMDPKALEQPDGETLLWAAPSRAMAEFLITLKIDPQARDKHKDTALHEACRRSRKDVVELLLDSGLGIETKGKWDMPPLHSAACTLDGEPRTVVYLLLARGANINSKGHEGKTALHECAFYNRLEMAELLLARGAEVEAKDDKGRTPMDLLILGGKKERLRLMNLLIKHGAPGRLVPLREIEEPG